MEIELVVIGDEVLAGFTVNTNAAFIAQELLKNGYSLSRQTVLQDEASSLLEGLETVLQRSDVVITTGGLGPTVDDRTREVIAKLYHVNLGFDEHIANHLEARFGKDLPTLKNQATVPENTEIFLNSVGTAPGFVMRKENSTLIVLPGVPDEMKAMLTEQAIPYLVQAFPLEERVYRKILNICEIPELAVDPFLRELKTKHPDIAIGIYPSPGLLTIRLGVAAIDEAAAMEKLEKPFAALETRFAANCFESETGRIEEAVHHLFVENGWTLSFAESCTGGSAAGRITLLAGASDYFLGSIVAYSNVVKTEVLGVSESIIRENGAVSAETAIAMVQGALTRMGSDFALAVTGIAGPAGGSAEKPMGTVWCAVCRRGEKPHTWVIHARGNRQMVITRSVNSLLSHLLIYAKETSLL
ncbi:MAG: CinA family nicotinamide mononucleotide deamidase-related protein [Waddliaceae bacterium]